LILWRKIASFSSDKVPASNGSLLRARRERPSYSRAAKQRDELATSFNHLVQ
jgi:hypothetical protein